MCESAPKGSWKWTCAAWGSWGTLGPSPRLLECDHGPSGITGLGVPLLPPTRDGQQLCRRGTGPWAWAR